MVSRAQRLLPNQVLPCDLSDVKGKITQKRTKQTGTVLTYMQRCSLAGRMLSDEILFFLSLNIFQMFHTEGMWLSTSKENSTLKKEEVGLALWYSG